MTNEQLAILLDKYWTKLQFAIYEIRQSLPVESERDEPIENVVQKSFGSGDYIPKIGDFSCLRSLKALADTMEQDIKLLRGEKQATRFIQNTIHEMK